MDDKWTIRRVSADARALVEEVHGMTGVPYGRLVSDAIRVWFEMLGDGEPAHRMVRFRTRRTN